MADTVDFSITGLDSLLGKLDAVNYDVKRKGGRSALRKAAQVVAARVKDGARSVDDPATAEMIAENVAVRWSNRRFKRTGDLMFRVGILGGAKQYANTRENVRKGRAGQTYKTGGDKRNPGGDTWYWRLVEFGTEKVPARPFMRPAMEQSMGEATAVFVQAFERSINSSIRRAAKRAAKGA